MIAATTVALASITTESLRTSTGSTARSVAAPVISRRRLVAEESRQVRRARERREQFDRIHGNVLAGRTVLDMWRTYARERLTPHGIDIADPAVDGTMRQAFYAGAAAMLELMTRVSPDDVSEDQ